MLFQSALTIRRILCHQHIICVVVLFVCFVVVFVDLVIALFFCLESIYVRLNNLYSLAFKLPVCIFFYRQEASKGIKLHSFIYRKLLKPSICHTGPSLHTGTGYNIQAS